MTRQTYYALRRKNSFSFFCVSNTQEQFHRKLASSFSSWLGIQSKGSHKTIDDYMAGLERVKISIEVIK